MKTALQIKFHGDTQQFLTKLTFILVPGTWPSSTCQIIFSQCKAVQNFEPEGCSSILAIHLILLRKRSECLYSISWFRQWNITSTKNWRIRRTLISRLTKYINFRPQKTSTNLIIKIQTTEIISVKLSNWTS